MEQIDKLYDDDEMNEETYDAFVAGLRVAIKKSGYKSQRDFAAVVGIPPETVSKHINKRQKMRDDNIKKYAECLNISEPDIVMMGRDVLAEAGKQRAEHVRIEKHAGTSPMGNTEVDSFLSAAWSLAAQYRKSDERKKWWREIFDMLPSPALIVRNGIIEHQNKPAMIWGVLVGQSIDNIRLDEDMDPDNCPLKTAIQTNQETSLCQYIRDDYYKVIATPVRYSGEDFFIVTATEINECMGGFRRDRRLDVRREDDKDRRTI